MPRNKAYHREWVGKREQQPKARPQQPRQERPCQWHFWNTTVWRFDFVNIVRNTHVAAPQATGTENMICDQFCSSARRIKWNRPMSNQLFLLESVELKVQTSSNRVVPCGAIKKTLTPLNHPWSTVQSPYVCSPTNPDELRRTQALCPDVSLILSFFSTWFFRLLSYKTKKNNAFKVITCFFSLVSLLQQLVFPYENAAQMLFRRTPANSCGLLRTKPEQKDIRTKLFIVVLTFFNSTYLLVKHFS